ncbi:cation:dicarboxylate symporter family transporter [Methyloprofundus sp.]|uniref:cation:dicarboxylate symporter family transporter n=1 Tax=Methyloprofundus sp. TaxID=2020875 RepID=UPI003D0EF7F3
MSLSSKIFLGMGLGILCGLFFGEMTAVFKVPADIFILLLQMTVLPYVTLSLIVGFGSLTFVDAKLLAIKGTAVMLLLWALAFFVLALMPLAFPAWETASFFSASMIEAKEDVNYYEIFIPANPFYSMSHNLVPAVVVFSICLGVALIGIKDKEPLLLTFSVFKEALTKVTGFMVSLMPLGIFAIAANAAGTMNIEEFDRLQVYLILYIAVSLLFTFWILPGLVAALTPIRYRDILSLTKDAMVTAFMTATLLVVLPLLVENSRALLNKYKLETDRSDAVLDAAIPASFNFPQTGKVLAMSFILFAAWFTDDPVALTDYPMLMISGLASFFGSLNVAIPFLLDLQQIPSDMFQLFIVSGVLNSRFGTLLAAMHTLVLGVLVACAVTGGLKFNPKKIFRYTVVTSCLIVATIGATRLLFSYGISHEYKMDQIITEMHLLHDPVPAIVHKKPPSVAVTPDLGHAKLQAIKQRGFLRVGYLMNNLPFGFFNADNDLVGFDVEMAHILAKDLGVSLEFVPVTHDNIAMQLESNYCDIVMAGIVTTIDRATKVSFSNEYLSDTIAFIVKDYRRQEFISAEARAKLGSPRIGDYSHIPLYANLVHQYFPQAEIQPIENIDDFFNDKTPSVDAILATTQRGAAYTLLHPKFAVALPRPDLVKQQLAYPMSYQNAEFTRFINTWISLKKTDGTVDSLYNYWILGKNAVPVKPRWSVIRNVLHWVD